MSVPALISTAACAISVFVGFWHWLIYRRGPGERIHLAFALTCLAIAAFDVSSIGGYLTTSQRWSTFWQYGEQLTGALLSVPFVWFLVLTTQRKLNWFAHTVSAYFVTVMVVILLAPHAWIFSDLPKITVVDLPGGLRVVYNEVQHGPLLATISGISSFVILVVIGVAIFNFPRTTAEERTQARMVQVGIAAFLLGALNDIAVSRQLYPSLYLMEIAYLVLILAVTWGMSNAVLQLASTRAALRREHVRMQRILEAVNEVYVETTLDGTIREISPSARRTLGDPSGAKTLSMLDLYDDPKDRERLLTQLKACGRVDGFVAPVRIHGELRYGEVSAVLDEDEVTGEALVLASIRDITERREEQEAKAELERQLQQAQKLESLGVLAGGIAHDFNNLLTAIMGSIELAMMKLSAGPVTEALQLGLQSGQRAAELARLMLAYSGRGQSIVKPMDLNDFVIEMKELLTASATRRVRVVFDLSDEDLTVEADGSQLSQVLLNLVLNGAEAIAGDGGLVRVTTRWAECSEVDLRSEYAQDAPKPGPYAILEVSDDGKGMDAATLSRLFDPFFTTKFSGRGLGLSAVLGIIRAHDGTIQVQSQPRAGSTFRVFLPLSAKAMKARQTSEAPPMTWQGSGRALVVDDEVAVLQVTAELLQQIGFEVTSFQNPQDALEHFSASPEAYELAVVDRTMPELDGEIVIERLHVLQPQLPTLLISGHCSEESAKRTASVPHSRFLQKPFSLDSLRREVRSISRSGRS